MVADRDDSFRFAYSPSAVRYGEGAVGELDDELAAQGVERALVVTGRTVGASDAVMDPVREGMGDRLAGVFAETTPDKRIATAIDAATAMQEAGADGFVAVGGGSSIDVATAARVVAAGDRSRSDVAEEMVARGTIEVPDAPLPPLVAVPTTLAGAELSQVAGITAEADDRRGVVTGGISDPRLMPSAVVADPELYATTPTSVLAGSAMNGFDKAIETIYSRRATPFTDATAVRGLRLLREALPAMTGDGGPDGPGDGGTNGHGDGLPAAVRGTLLAQYGASRPDGSTLSVMHAFGHALRDHADVQQGIAHAVVAPAALAYVFERVDGRRDLLAEGLGVSVTGKDREAVADEVVAAVAGVRDALDLPDALADVEGVAVDDLDRIARLALDDDLWANAPPGLEPTVDDLEAVLRSAWGA